MSSAPPRLYLLLTLLGTGWVMVVNAFSYLATVVALRRIRPDELYRTTRAAGRARVIDGLRYIRRMGPIS